MFGEGWPGHVYSVDEKLHRIAMREGLRRALSKKGIKAKRKKSIYRKMQNRGTNHKAPWLIYRKI